MTRILLVLTLLLAACYPTKTPSLDTVNDVVSKFLFAQKTDEEKGAEKGRLIADVNTDWREDIVLAWVTEGPTYWHSNLTVFLQQKDGTFQKADTLQLNGLINQSPVMENRRITIDQKTYGPKDAICCPSVPAIKTYRLKDGKIVETAEK